MKVRLILKDYPSKDSSIVKLRLDLPSTFPEIIEKMMFRIGACWLLLPQDKLQDRRESWTSYIPFSQKELIRNAFFFSGTNRITLFLIWWITTQSESKSTLNFLLPEIRFSIFQFCCQIYKRNPEFRLLTKESTCNQQLQLYFKT